MLIAPYGQEAGTTLPVGFSLLIVEDDPVVCARLQLLLRNDYHLTIVERGSDALAALREQPIHLVLLDMALEDSQDVLRQMRSVRSSADLPIILLALLSDPSAAVRGLQLGANDYITKPLDDDAVRTRISTQLALRHAEDEGEQAINQLKFTQEMQENFTRIVSHDLKGPLTNIRMAQFMLREMLRDNADAHNILDTMDVTLTGMIEMIRVFLDAMDSQRLEPNVEPLHAHDLIVEVIEQYRLAADRKRIRLAISASHMQVRADHKLLRQVLGNLLSNAIKFSPPESEVSIRAEARDGSVYIYVTDQGPGILPEERCKLFAMFGKLSARPTGGETSTGLGLWIVKQLAELQNGQVGVDQPEDGGSAFWVALPEALPEA